MMQSPGQHQNRSQCPGKVRKATTRKAHMIATLEETPSMQRADSGTVVASLEGVSKNYGEIRALRNVNFTVRAGQVVALARP